MPTTVTLEDSGEFITTSAFSGVAHPPGYPLYSIVGRFFSMLPLGNVAVRLHFMSGFFAALACCGLFLNARILGAGRIASIAGALVYGVSLTFWSQAIIAEVYSLNAFFFFLLLYITLRYLRSNNEKTLMLAAFLLGLSFSNHWPLMIMGALAFLLLLVDRLKLLVAQWYKYVGLFLLGLLPYLYVWVRSHSYFTFSGPIDTLSEFWWYVSRAGYSGVDNPGTAVIADHISYIAFFFTNLVREVGILGIMAGCAGMILAYMRLSKQQFFALLLAFLASSVLIKPLLNFEYNDWKKETFLTYQLVPVGIVALFAAFALEAIYEKVEKKFSPRPAEFVMGPIAALTVLACFAVNLGHNYRRGDTVGADFARVVFKHLPPNAHLFVWGDMDTGPVAYLHHLEKLRPDIRVYSQFGALLGNRLYNLRRSTFAHAVGKIYSHLSEYRTIYAITRGNVLLPLKNVYLKRYGIFAEISLDQTAELDQDAIVESSKKILNGFISGKYKGKWTYLQGGIAAKTCQALVLQGQEHRAFKVNKMCKLIKAKHLLFGERNYLEASKLYRELIAHSQGLRRQDIVTWYQEDLQAQLGAIESGVAGATGYQAAADFTLPALDLNRSCNNAVAKSLLKLRREHAIRLPDDVAERFGHCRGFNQ